MLHALCLGARTCSACVPPASLCFSMLEDYSQRAPPRRLAHCYDAADD
jgi:hypothetical protein